MHHIGDVIDSDVTKVRSGRHKNNEKLVAQLKCSLLSFVIFSSFFSRIRWKVENDRFEKIVPKELIGEIKKKYIATRW